MKTQQMKKQTYQSFFTTKEPPNTSKSKNDKEASMFYVIKKNKINHCSSIQKQQNTDAKRNIFRQEFLREENFDENTEKPIGGKTNFLKFKNKSFLFNESKIKDKPQKHKAKIQNKSLFIIDTQSFVRKNSEETMKSQQFQNSSEMYKSQYDYQKNKEEQSRIFSKTTLKRPQTSKSTNHRDIKFNQWVHQKTKQYQNKLGYLNESTFNKPLVQRYGMKYFQYFLRNRFQGDLPSPTYIHQIDDSFEKEVNSSSQFIAKLKKMKPNLKNYQKMTLKGKKLNLFEN